MYFAFKFNVDGETNCENGLSEEELLKAILFYAHTKKVKIPHKYQVKLHKKFKNSADIRKLLKQDEIPVPVLKILEGL